MYRPENMSPEELKQGCYDIRLKFNTYRSIFSRAFEFKANSKNLINLGIYFIANLVTKKEISRKMGRPLGV